MNIGELSSAAFTSNATVVRLCQKLGVDGYRGFRIALAAELERARSEALAINPDQPFLEGQSTRDIMKSITELTKQAVDACYASISTADIRKAAELILDARRIALYAIGDSCISTMAFSNLLLKIGITCFNANEFGDSLAVSQALGPSDVALLVTYSGTLLDILGNEVSALRARGCHTIVITADESISEHMAGTDCLILIPNDENRKERIATYYSQMCIRYVLNCIYGECFSRHYGDNLERRTGVSSGSESWW